LLENKSRVDKDGRIRELIDEAEWNATAITGWTLYSQWTSAVIAAAAELLAATPTCRLAQPGIHPSSDTTANITQFNVQYVESSISLMCSLKLD